jgi:hypothetical protein
MSKYYTYNNQIVCKVGEVSVHNSIGIPEAHMLFKGNGHYLTMGINDFERYMEPVKSAHLIELIDNERKATAITQSLILTHGDVEMWATRRRTRPQVRARQLFFWSMRHATSYTLLEISKMLPGGYDHATLIHACATIDREIECGEQEIIASATAIAESLEVIGCLKLRDRISALCVRSEVIKQRTAKMREALN